MSDVEPARSGLVLSGGGAYAAYEVGVMRALVSGMSPANDFQPLNAEVVTGTSAGSVNAALFASQRGEAIDAMDFVEWAWVSRIAEQPRGCGSNVLRLRANPFSLLDPDCLAVFPRFSADFAEDIGVLTEEAVARGAMFLGSDAPLRRRLLEVFDVGTLITGEPLGDLLTELVDFEEIRRFHREFRVAATNWRTGELRVFRNEDMTEEHGVKVLLASSAIPGVLPSVDIGDDPYVDGGVVMNTPLRPAIQAGATELHVIYMDPDVRHIPLPRRRNTLNTLYRTLVISFGLVVSRDIRTAAAINRRLREDPAAAHRTALTGQPREQRYRPLTIHRYHPAEDLGGTFRWLDFERDHIVRLIQRGYEDACAHDCEANRCLVEGREHALIQAETAEWARRDA